jgi:hypothetical protein
MATIHFPPDHFGKRLLDDGDSVLFRKTLLCLVSMDASLLPQVATLIRKVD